MSGRPIFVLGCERSGTTLLRAMLTSHPHIAIPYEAHRFSTMLSVRDPWTHVWSREEAHQPIREFLSRPKPMAWNLAVEGALAKLPPSGTVRFADVIRAVYEAYAAKEAKPRWGDKTPSNSFEMPHLVREFPEAQFIHLVRDGRDVHCSWLKVDWGNFDVVKSARKWSKWVQASSEFGPQLGRGRYLECRYEELVRAPRETLQRICDFLGEPFHDAMLSYHANGQHYVPEARHSAHQLLSKPPDASRACAWKQQMAPAELRQFERHGGRMLVRFGYPVSSWTRLRVATRGLVRRAGIPITAQSP